MATEVSLPFSSSEFKTAWEAWVKFRKEIRHSLTPSTIDRQLKRLASWGEQRAIQAIESSIEHGWQGLFEPRPSRFAAQAPAAKVETAEEKERRIMAERTQRHARYGL